jgi:predicted DCC family thiol-disulfide oxidoreductase YuxK
MLLLWDRECGFCAWTLSLLLRADRARVLRPAPIQGPEGERHLAHLAPERRLASWHLVEDDGRVSSGGAALSRMLRAIPAGRPLAHLTGALPGATDRGYEWVATHRSLLSRAIPAESKERARRHVQARAAKEAVPRGRT